MAPTTAMRTLDVAAPQKVSYCIPLWLRDEQIRVNVEAVKARFEPWLPNQPLREEPIAIVCYGPSLNDTWEEIRAFPFVMTCSGAHKFLLERGIVPTWHLDVDPRAHKIPLIGEPDPRVEYLLAATCHPSYFRKLLDGGFNVKLWHVFDGEDAGMRNLPPGEWAITGGCSVGLRALTLARLLGFGQLHIFGMDGSEGKSGKHAAAHPNQAPQVFETVYGGVTYQTTPAFLEAARQTFHELDQLKDVTATFHGEGLVQHMARDYVRRTIPDPMFVAFNKPELISQQYRDLNARLHRDNLAYGVGGGKYAEIVMKLAESIKTRSVLDYGCGKGYLAKALPFPIWEYDPAIPDKSASPRPADLVICTDVLEHVEPETLPLVLDDLRRCVKQVGYFVIHTGPAKKHLADGRNAHLVQQDAQSWRLFLQQFFHVAKMWDRSPEVHFIVAPRKAKAQPKADKASAVVDARLQPAVPPAVIALDRLQFLREPYPIGSASDVLPAALYANLAISFPPLGLFRAFSGGNRKWSLSPVNNPEQYRTFLASHPIWSAFYDYVQSSHFIPKVAEALAAHGLEPLKGKTGLTSRFEFSLLPADGGCLRPHTDIDTKLVTLVVSMLPSLTDWDQAWGGGTDVLRPKDGAQPLESYKAEFDEFDVVHTFPYVPNQCVVFVKTAQSWHSVGPLAGPAGLLRKTLTINIEAK